MCQIVCKVFHKHFFKKSYDKLTRCSGIPVIPAFGRLRQKDPKFETSMSYTARIYFEKKPKQPSPQNSG
jgi:hypothetical protein